jgi:hypothetical protein
MSVLSRPFPWLAASALLPLLVSFASSAQGPPPTPPNTAGTAPMPAVSVQVVVGSSLGGPEGVLEEEVDSPESSAAGRLSLWFAGRVPIGKGRWRAGLGCSWTNLGEFEGHPAGSGGSGGSDGTWVSVKTSVLSAGPMVWLEAAPALQLGAGPMVHVVDVDAGVSFESGVDPPEGTNRRWRVGLLAEAAIRLPAERPFYVLLLGQYRWIPDATVDIPVRQGTASVNVPLSHGLVAAGLGLRF